MPFLIAILQVTFGLGKQNCSFMTVAIKTVSHKQASHDGARELIESSCRKIDEGMTGLAFEAKSIKADIAQTRQRRHKLAKHPKLSKGGASESSLLGVG